MFPDYYYLIEGTWFTREEAVSGEALSTSNSHYHNPQGKILKRTDAGWIPVTPAERRALPPLPTQLVQRWLFNG